MGGEGGVVVNGEDEESRAFKAKQKVKDSAI